MFIPIKPFRRANHAKIDITRIVKNSTASRSPTHQLDRRISPANTRRLLGNLREAVQVDLQPGILVAAKDDAGRVDVEREDGRVGGRDLEEAVLDGEVEEGVGGFGEVDLGFVGGVGCGGCEVGEAGC